MTKTDFVLKTTVYYYPIYIGDDYTLLAMRKNEFGDWVQTIPIQTDIFYKLYRDGDIVDTKFPNLKLI